MASSSSRQDLFNAMGSMYNAVLFVGIQNSASVQPVLAIGRTVFYRERAAGMYSAFPYALAQVKRSLFSLYCNITHIPIITQLTFSVIGFDRATLYFCASYNIFCHSLFHDGI